MAITRTYTVLVTVHDGRPRDRHEIARIVAVALETGVDDHEPVLMAQADAFDGDRLDAPLSGPVTLAPGSVPAKTFHAHLRSLRNDA